MKQTLHIIAFAAVAIAALTSCAKEQFKENAIPAGEKIEVSINGLIGEFTTDDATKATAESVVRVTWGAGDKVYVYDGGNASIGTLTVTPDENNASYAMLSGTITASSASPAPSKLTLVYVKGATEAPTIAGGKISIDLSNQNQAEVPFVLYTTVDYDAAALTKTNEYISFFFATSVMTVNCTGLQTGASGAVAAIDKAEIDGVSTACELTIDGSGVTAVAGTTPGTITRTGASVFTQSDSRGAFRLALAADPTAPAARNILVFQGSKVSGAPFTTTTLAGGKSYNTVYQMGEYVAPPAGILPGGFTVNAQGKKVFFTKGNLWYGTAYGESSPAFHFENEQWESTPSADGARNSAHVSHFYWSRDARVAYASNYVTANQTYGISPSETDVLFTNDPADDEKANGGFTVNGETGKYRSLSAAEWQYLFSYDGTEGGTQPSETNYDNEVRRGKYKYGVTVCGKTNCIVLLPDVWDTDVISLASFATTTEYGSATTPTWSAMEAAGAVCLPAAGHDGGYGVYNVGNAGIYASSTPNGKNYPYRVEFDNSSLKIYKWAYRDIGISIRLVSESDGYSPAVKVTGVTLNKTMTSIDVGDSETLVATVAPANATNRQVNWSSSDTSVATVDAASGEVTGVAPGSAVITATTEDGNFTAVCLVTVKALPAGALKGKFSVSATKKVYFSKGNLWYGKLENAQTATFNFEENQYSISSTWSTDHISHFYWNKDASLAYAESNNEAGASDNDNFFTNSDQTTAKTDFTVNGQTNVWRTLSHDEWKYLFENHTYKYVSVNGKYGIVIAPDGFSGTIADSYDATGWATAESNGLVFLPNTGFRNNGASISETDKSCFYWTSTALGNQEEEYENCYFAYRVFFQWDNGSLKYEPDSKAHREWAIGIRLVTE